MKRLGFARLLTISCVTALVAVGLMVWSLFEPTPMPVLVAMSAGQVLGTLSLGLFLMVVIADLRRAHIERELESPSERPAP